MLSRRRDMSRLMLALALLIASGASPAEACRLHSIWHYPWPQRCAVAHPSRASIQEKKAEVQPEMPLPSLAAIDWGEPADDEARGRLELKVKLEAK
jgi:hypothetical protein